MASTYDLRATSPLATWKRLAMVCLTLVAYLSTSPALGQIFPNYWLNPAGGDYGNGANWSEGAPGDTEVFRLGSPGYSVNFGTAGSGGGILGVLVAGDNPTFNFQGSGLGVGPFGLVVNAGSSLTLVGPGSLSNTQDQVPYTINGQVIVNGASLTQTGLQVGFGEGPTGSLVIENGGSVGAGDLDSQVSLDGGLTMNDGELGLTGVSVELSLPSATITNGSEISLGYDNGTDAINFDGPCLVDNSTISTSLSATASVGGSLTIQNGGSVQIATSLDASGTVKLLSGGTLSTGSLDLHDVLDIQLNSQTNDPLQFGDAQVSGILNITLAPGFTPTIGEDFSLFPTSPNEEGIVSGTFGLINLPPLNGGGKWDTSQLYTNGIISVVPEPASVGLLIGTTTLLLRRSRRA